METKTKTYECVCCQYITKRKINYDRHIESVRHLKIETGKPDKKREDKDEYIIRLQTELNNALEANKTMEEYYKNKIKKLQNSIQKSIQIEEKPKENPIKFDISDRFS